MILSVHFNQLDFFSYKKLVDALLSITEEDITVSCHSVIPENLKEKGSTLISTKDHWYNETLMKYLRAKEGVDENSINKYIMENFNDRTVQDLLISASFKQ